MAADKEPAPKAKRPRRSLLLGNRCSKVEKRIRIVKLLTLARNGFSTQQLEEYAMDQFCVKLEVARQYVAEALDENLESYMVMDKRRMAALTLCRFENAYRIAASQQNPSAMTAANSQIALHWVHRAPEITVSGGQSASKEDQAENF